MRGVYKTFINALHCFSWRNFPERKTIGPMMDWVMKEVLISGETENGATIGD
jgi:hypothetical protein